jgi:hypothetical protein
MRYIDLPRYNYTRPITGETKKLISRRSIGNKAVTSQYYIRGNEQLDEIAQNILGAFAQWYVLADMNAGSILAYRGKFENITVINR